MLKAMAVVAMVIEVAVDPRHHHAMHRMAVGVVMTVDHLAVAAAAIHRATMAIVMARVAAAMAAAADVTRMGAAVAMGMFCLMILVNSEQSVQLQLQSHFKQSKL